MAGIFEQIIQMMVDSGAYYLFIWLLFAALMYGLIEKYDFFGDTSANGGAALAGSFFVLLGIFVYAPEGLFLNFAAAIGFILFAIFGLIIVLSIGGVDVTELGDGLQGDSQNQIAGIGLILVALAFIAALGFNFDLGSIFSGTENMWRQVAFPILFLIFLLLVIKEMT